MHVHKYRFCSWKGEQSSWETDENVKQLINARAGHEFGVRSSDRFLTACTVGIYKNIFGLGNLER